MGTCNFTSLDELIDEVSSSGEMEEYNYYHVRATVSAINSAINTVVYTGCPKDCCKKRVSEFFSIITNIHTLCGTVTILNIDVSK